MKSNTDDEFYQDRLITTLEKTLEMENDLLRTYVITSESVHHNESLKERLVNFAEGNAKRTKQLIDEIEQLKQ